MTDNVDVLQEVKLLKAKVQKLEDEKAVREIISRYAYNIDLGRVDNCLRLWTDDCVFITDAHGELAYTKGKENVRTLMKNPPPELKTFPQHLQVNYVFNVDGDTATAVGYQIMTAPQGDGFGIRRCGLRVFRLQRIKGTWLIKETESHIITNRDACQECIPESW